MPLPTPIKIDWGQIASATLPVMVCGWYVLLYLVVLSQNVSRHNQRRWTLLLTSCPLQAAVTSNGLALQFASQTLKGDEEVVWCAVNQEQSMGFPWISLCLNFFWWTSLIDVEIRLPRVIFLCSSARHHRMCSLDLIRPYLKHPFPGRKGPSFLNSCNLQFHINVGSWLVWGPPPQTNSNLVYWIIRSFFPPPPQQFFWIVNLSKDFNWFQFTFNWNQFTFKWFQFTFNWNQFTFNWFSIDFNLLSIDFNLLSIDFNLLSIDFNLLSIDFNLLSIDFNLLSIGFNLLSIDFNLLSIDFQLISIYFQLIFNWFQFTFDWFQFTFNWFQFTFNWFQFTFNLLSIDFNLLSIYFQLIFNWFQFTFDWFQFTFNLLSRFFFFNPKSCWAQ